MKHEQQQASLNIMLADDDPDDRYFFEEALRDFPLPTQLTVVHDGEQLIQLLTNEVNELPHILFLDLNMPRKNGFECLSEIKLNKRLQQLPVVIYSTSFHKRIADMLYKNGANYYISKPFEIYELKKAVQQMLTVRVQENISQPTKENFLITTEKKNSKTFFWFNNYFSIPFLHNFNK
jgi:CheY-like chemotaxis protein